MFPVLHAGGLILIVKEPPLLQTEQGKIQAHRARTRPAHSLEDSLPILHFTNAAK